jgi:hypothetical protein
VQETVYELLTQQLELARIEEAKDIPVVSVIDSPSVPEKKFFPPRLLLTLALTTAITAIAALLILLQSAWAATEAANPAKALLSEMTTEIRAVLLSRGRSLHPLRRKAAQ